MLGLNRDHRHLHLKHKKSMAQIDNLSTGGEIPHQFKTATT